MNIAGSSETFEPAGAMPTDTAVLTKSQQRIPLGNGSSQRVSHPSGAMHSIVVSITLGTPVQSMQYAAPPPVSSKIFFAISG
jgi:hypothetical protein